MSEYVDLEVPKVNPRGTSILTGSVGAVGIRDAYNIGRPDATSCVLVPRGTYVVEANVGNVPVGLSESRANTCVVASEPVDAKPGDVRTREHDICPVNGHIRDRNILRVLKVDRPTGFGQRSIVVRRGSRGSLLRWNFFAKVEKDSGRGSGDSPGLATWAANMIPCDNRLALREPSSAMPAFIVIDGHATC